MIDSILLYGAVILLCILFFETAIFLVLRSFDKQKIENLKKEVKESHNRNLQYEVSRAALVRQNDERLLIIKKLEEKIKIYKNRNLEENIRDL